jgi:inorganic phosphate transporter, PiT family
VGTHGGIERRPGRQSGGRQPAAKRCGFHAAASTDMMLDTIVVVSAGICLLGHGCTPSLRGEGATVSATTTFIDPSGATSTPQGFKPIAVSALQRRRNAANSIATIVSTRVLRPQFAVFWAAFFNFVAFLVFGLNVAQTIGTGIIEPSIVDAQVIFAALFGAIVWNLVTWALGIPSSSSHALIGGLVGGGMAKAGISAAVWSGLSKAVLAIVLSPLVGFLLAMVLVGIVSWASVRSTPFAVDRAFRILQFASASLYSLGHGGNDAQKTMGIIAVLLYSQGHLGREFSVPFWVVLSCQAAMALGTLMGGWRIVRTMGLRITKLTPMQGFCAETGGAATLFMATFLGVPVSTTHTITGAIVGVGAARRVSAVRWNVASSIVYAWVITIPASALVAALSYWAVQFLR